MSGTRRSVCWHECRGFQPAHPLAPRTGIRDLILRGLAGVATVVDDQNLVGEVDLVTVQSAQALQRLLPLQWRQVVQRLLVALSVTSHAQDDTAGECLGQRGGIEGVQKAHAATQADDGGAGWHGRGPAEGTAIAPALTS